jgi:hypothetical protein
MCKKSSVVSALNAIGFTLLVLASLACALSFVAPFWIVYPDRSGIPNVSHILDTIEPVPVYPFVKASWRGLLAVCFKESNVTAIVTGSSPDTKPHCIWFAEKGFQVEKTLPDWYLACQCLLATAVGLFLLTLIIQSVYSCCCCCQRPACLPTFVASLTVTAGVLSLSSLALYAGFSSQAGEFSPPGTIIQGVVVGGGHPDWAFYVGIAGSGAAILSAILFYCDGCRLALIYKDYKPPTVTTERH